MEHSCRYRLLKIRNGITISKRWSEIITNTSRSETLPRYR